MAWNWSRNLPLPIKWSINTSVSKQPSISSKYLSYLPTRPLRQWMLRLCIQIPFLLGHVRKSRWFELFNSPRWHSRKETLTSTLYFAAWPRTMCCQPYLWNKNMHFSPSMLHASTQRTQPSHSCWGLSSLGHVPQHTKVGMRHSGLGCCSGKPKLVKQKQSLPAYCLAVFLTRVKG